MLPLKSRCAESVGRRDDSFDVILGYSARVQGAELIRQSYDVMVAARRWQRGGMEGRMALPRFGRPQATRRPETAGRQIEIRLSICASNEASHGQETTKPQPVCSFARIMRRIASGRDGGGSWHAIHPSKAARSAGCKRTPTTWP